MSTLSFLVPRTQSNVSTQLYLHFTLRVETNLADINSELDELDREEFYRLKKVAGKKQRDTAAEDEELKVRKEAQQAAQGGAKAGKEEEDGEPADMLADGDDDVIF